MTKHFIYAGANIVAAAGAPWFLMAVDQVGYVPITGADVTGTTGRTITMTAIAATAAKVDRYPNGVGLRAFFSTEVAPTAGGPNLTAFGYKDVAGAARLALSRWAWPLRRSSARCRTRAARRRATPRSSRWRLVAPASATSNPSPCPAAPPTPAQASWCCTWSSRCGHPAAGVRHSSGRRIRQYAAQHGAIKDGACIQWMLMNTGATTANAPLTGESAHAWG
jgi:hypothetical protein